jgi:hypothetical protein
VNEKMLSHQRSSSEKPSKSVIGGALVVDFTLVPTAVSQDFKTEGRGKDNENSLILHLIYMPEK